MEEKMHIKSHIRKSHVRRIKLYGRDKFIRVRYARVQGYNKRSYSSHPVTGEHTPSDLLLFNAAKKHRRTEWDREVEKHKGKGLGWIIENDKPLSHGLLVHPKNKEEERMLKSKKGMWDIDQI